MIILIKGLDLKMKLEASIGTRLGYKGLIDDVS